VLREQAVLARLAKGRARKESDDPED